ncbi:amidohydrolase family protein [Candidatus Uabimicrobium sp. HlEnr_7]|uniref:amidohydrolase family protein n=1 Tax=Candidatus Uabimicrobium helgolandensis TaxID=3095367 RepID=UPI0035564298
MKKFIRSKFLIPISDKIGRATRIKDGYVLFEGEKILEVGAFNEELGRNLLERYPNHIEVVGNNNKTARSLDDFIRLEGVLLPGFIKAHGHDHESPLIGIVKDAPLTEWLDGAVNIFGKFMQENQKQLADTLGIRPHLATYLKARVDDIYYGITSSMVHHCNYNKYYVGDIVEANEIAGTNMIVAVGSQDRHYYDAILDSPQDAVKRLDENVERFGKLTRTRVVPGPDQFFSNGPDLLKALKGWADKNSSLIHIHSSEEFNTTEWFKKEYGMTPVEYGMKLGFLGPNTVLAHQVQCTKRDLEILKDTQTKIVHNPLANTILGSGIPPVIEMLESGIDVVISTDGSGSADSQNILAAARLASQYQKAFHQNARLMPAQKIMEMITIEPAKLLGINAGSLECGKDADMVFMDTTRPNLTPSKINNVLENLIWASDGSEARYVIAGGKVVKDNYQFTTLDMSKVNEQVQQLSEMFEDYREEQLKLKGTGAHC